MEKTQYGKINSYVKVNSEASLFHGKVVSQLYIVPHSDRNLVSVETSDGCKLRDCAAVVCCIRIELSIY